MTFNSSSSVIQINTVNPDSAVTYLAFTAIAVTQNNNYFELLTLRKNAVTSWSYRITSKFTFTNSPNLVWFFQWVTAADQSSFSYDNYWASIIVNHILSTSTVSINFSRDPTYLRAVRMNIVIFNSFFSGYPIRSYLYLAQNGGNVAKTFISNFGVSVVDFGEPVSGAHCLLGLNNIDLFFYRNAAVNSNPVSFTFTFSNQTVSDIPYSNAYGLTMHMGCFGFLGICLMI